ncbi:MAG TPA: septal ring lytic transglycosylase RlpA family protein [Patescibacteria group bacterium]|nr:septal ring lytic transglycosylase RlpA family protein [Patescibacteria group bacterium]
MTTNGYILQITTRLSIKDTVVQHFKNLFIIITALIFLQSCASSVRFTSGETSSGGTTGSTVSSNGRPGGGTSVPVGSTFRGLASYYGDKFHGRTTANGEIFDQQQLTAAHRSFPFGTIVKVTNIKNNQSVVVRVNDRGPFVDGRIIDLSRQAAEKIDMIRAGVAEVEIEVLQ